MDISAFDFELDEVARVLSRLPELATTVEIEPRLHDLDEEEDVHAKRADPTFRIQCLLRGDDSALGRAVELGTELGLETVLDRDRTVRFRHLRPNDVHREGSSSS